MGKLIDPIVREQIKGDYLSGKGNLRELSLKYQVSDAALQAYSQRHGWKRLRDKLKGKTEEMTVAVSERGMERATEKVAERISAHIESMLSGSMALRDKLLANLQTQTVLPPVLKHDTLESGIRSLQRLDQISRLNLGLPSVVQAVDVTSQGQKISGDRVLQLIQASRELVLEGKTPTTPPEVMDALEAKVKAESDIR